MSNPFTPAQLWALADQFGTPLWVYDAATIRQRIAQVSNFDTVRFAQKACSNIHILQLMREQGVKVDAVSRGDRRGAADSALLARRSAARYCRVWMGLCARLAARLPPCVPAR